MIVDGLFLKSIFIKDNMMYEAISFFVLLQPQLITHQYMELNSEIVIF